ncbi:MAG: helix-turn-helix transcriptional regulator [Opitutaceae bacterium]|nr:helix-turn-helix transcriptional regulator [Opitutaceae bacterium]
MLMGKNLSGPAIKKYRDKRGLSQEQLAAAAQRAGWDIGRDVIAKVETGARYVADIELVKFAKLLHVSAKDLLPKGS